jgi:hypothetical protein
MRTINREIVLDVVDCKYEGELKSGLIKELQTTKFDQLPCVDLVASKAAYMYRIRVRSKRNSGVQIPGGDQAVEALESLAENQVRLIIVTGETDNYFVFTDLEDSCVIGVLAVPAGENSEEYLP